MTRKELTAKIKRKAVTFQVGGFRPDERPESSWIGKVLLGKAGEEWPESNGEPMMPVCQLNLEELPFKPSNLADIAFITFFVDSKSIPDGKRNGEGWLLRTYSRMDELVKIKAPAVKFDIKPFQLKPQLVENDFPCREDCPVEIPDKLEDEYSDIFPNNSGIKVGGWPTLIQSEIFWSPANQDPAEPEYVFQIDSVEKAQWQWGDNGVAYLARGTKAAKEGEWFFSWDCH